MKVQDLARVMEAIAPLELAESWDNVGLLTGSLESPLSGPVLLTIDLTERVLAEAVQAKASAVVAYHPPIFDAMSGSSLMLSTGYCRPPVISAMSVSRPCPAASSGVRPRDATGSYTPIA